MQQRSILKDMMDYIRTWWLLNRLSAMCLKEEARVRRENKIVYVQGKAARKAILFPMENFLEKRAEKYLFGIGRFLSLEWRDLRIEKDRKLLQRAHNLKYTQSAIDPDLGQLVGTLPDGDYHAQWMNGFAGFLKEYKEAFLVLILVLGAINLHSQPAQKWMKEKFQTWTQESARVQNR